MAALGQNWRRSAGLLFGFAYAILFAFSVVAVVAFVWWATAGALDRKASDEITGDSEGLLAIYDKGGIAFLGEEIQRRLDLNVAGDAIYLLTGPNRNPIVGNLNRWPPELGDDPDSVRIQIDMWGMKVPAQIGQWRLRDGYHLLIGRDIHVLTMLRGILIDAVPWTLAIMIVLGIIGAAAVRRLFISMLADVSQTASAITAGDLTSRVPISGRGDEFDDLAETINEMLDRISRLMDGVRQVSNAIAHDLRTPITRARVRLEEATRDSATEADLRAAMERAIADLDGIVSVFHALLRIAETEAGSRRSAFAMFAAGTDVDRSGGALLRPVAEANGQTLTLQLPRRLMVFGDRDMVQQAAANLIDNALKFSPADSVVTVTAEDDPPAIIVGDHGPGIPEIDRERATERFFRGESARHAPGSGLGLALVQAVAGLHGGTLRLEDNAPGLRAVIALPHLGRPVVDQVSHAPQRVAIPRTA